MLWTSRELSRVILAGRTGQVRTALGAVPVMAALNDAGVTVYVVGHGEARASESPVLGIMRAIADYEDEHADDITR